jgi:hypothetical protein
MMMMMVINDQHIFGLVYHGLHAILDGMQYANLSTTCIAWFALEAFV